MNLLLDTHAFPWFIAGSERLSTIARDLIENPASQPFLSAASLWEMAIVPDQLVHKKVSTT